MTKTYKLIEKLLEVAECYSDGRETYEPFEQILREARSYLNNERSVMTEQHPITPPPELVQQWMEDFCCDSEVHITNSDWYLVAKAAQWGADQELEACCEWVGQWCGRWPDGTRPEGELRAARRPKPPSLKQQSIALLDLIQGNEKSWQLEDLDVVRRALEALPDE